MEMVETEPGPLGAEGECLYPDHCVPYEIYMAFCHVAVHEGTASNDQKMLVYMHNRLARAEHRLNRLLGAEWGRDAAVDQIREVERMKFEQMRMQQEAAMRAAYPPQTATGISVQSVGGSSDMLDSLKYAAGATIKAKL